MTGLLIVASVAVALIAIFAAYWIGRDSGEKSGFETQQYWVEQLTRNNVELKMDVERLRRERDGSAEQAARMWAAKEIRGDHV